jgi:GT2 family glycosyltransferase
LVCDDGSSCDMVGVVREAARDGALDVRYIWQPDRRFRASRSRNNGIRAAQGDLLVFVDGDVLIEEDFLARHAAAHRNPKQLVIGPMKRVPRRRIDNCASTLEHARRYRGVDAFPEAQARWARSRYPWMSCLSGNMSVPRAPEIHFDERFVGWGGEDRELAYRLTACHGHEVVYEPSAIAYHPGMSTGAHVMSDSNGIAAFLRNRLHFRSLYPDADLSPALDVIRWCALDPATDTWHVEVTAARSPDVVLREAERWLQAHDAGS